MSRDDEIYAIAEKNRNAFFPGAHKNRVRALRLLLRNGFSARWEERGDAIRRRCGFTIVQDAEGKSAAEDRALAVDDPAAAWWLLSRAPEIDPEYLGSVRDRLVEEPKTCGAAIALAAAPDFMRAAELLMREAFRRAAPFGVGACPKIWWRSSIDRDIDTGTRDRTAFSAIHAPIIDALGYGKWMEPRHAAERVFSATKYGVTIRPTLQWVARDMGEAMQFDAARSARIVTPGGIAYAGLDNPFEPLLRVQYAGFLVEKVLPDRVVLVVEDETPVDPATLWSRR